MPRPRLCRRVSFQPNITYFKPIGKRIIKLEEIILNVDEFEAVRLKDLLGLEQEKAAKEMNISQPTFHRLVLSARKKIADAIINSKAIKIKGGNFKMVQPREMGRGAGGGFGGPAINCICPQCGFKEQKIKSIPCVNMKCPKCGTLMTRGN